MKPAMADDDEGKGGGGLHFTLLLDKPLSGAVELAAWNADKDLLAMVTREHQLIVHRFNWQRLWAIVPERRATAICWRPDGKALAVGHHTGAIALHDVENGDLLRTIAVHQAPVECMHWAEEAGTPTDIAPLPMLYQDRTPRFFPPPPRPPAVPGTAPAFDLSGVIGEDNSGAGSRNGSRVLQQRLSVLVSGDKDGIICLSAFGVFPIGKLDIRKLSNSLQEPSALKVVLSNDLRHLTVLCDGELPGGVPGLHAIAVDTSLLGDRRHELLQVALQTSSVDELLDVAHASVTLMHKHWSDAMTAFADKFGGLAGILVDHGSRASPQEELFSLLACGVASSGLHQFLASSVGEAGLKRLGKSFEAAGRELHTVIADHLQLAGEMIAFRLGELLALSRYGKRFKSVGLEEHLMDRAMEDAGMVMVQIERVLRMVLDASAQFRSFLAWLTKALYQLNNEPLPQGDPPAPVEPAAVARFLRTQFQKDLLGPQLTAGKCTHWHDNDDDTQEELRMAELALMGGFQDVAFLKRTLFQQINGLADSCREAFAMPLKVMSPKLSPRSTVFLRHLPGLPRDPKSLPLSLMYFETKEDGLTVRGLQDYVCFHMSVNSGAGGGSSAVGILRGFGCQSAPNSFLEAVVVCIERRLIAIDLSLYKNQQLTLLVAERREAVVDKGSCRAWLLLLNLEGLPFSRISASSGSTDLLGMCSPVGAVLEIGLQDGKARAVSQPEAVGPLAVSASRGLACVFAGQRRALLYDLEEDEEEKDEEMD